MQQTPVTRGHVRGTFEVRTLFARCTAFGFVEPFPLNR
jgi:hypothetical protein